MSLVSENPVKIAFDRDTFEKLIEAAYVLQEHNAKMRQLERSLESQSEHLREQERVQRSSLEKKRTAESRRANPDYTVTLAEIVEAQYQIQMRHLDLEKTLALVAESVARITGASGAAIGILQGGIIRYRAGAGPTALAVGSEVASNGAICQASIRTGQVIRTKDVNTEFLFDPEPVRERGIRSLLAVPIHYDGEIVGGLELYFDEIEQYAEQDIHTCQLMAGLVTEAMGREAGVSLKKSMAEERSTMLAAIEKLQPNLAAIAEEQLPKPDHVEDGQSQASASIAKSVCWKCGNSVGAGDQFCGECGALQGRDTDDNSLQSKMATAWTAQQIHAREVGSATVSESDGEKPNLSRRKDQEISEQGAALQQQSLPVIYPPPFTPAEAEDLVKSLAPTEADAQNASEKKPALRSERATEHESKILDQASLDPPEISVPVEKRLVWSSASRAQDFLQSLPTYRTPGPLIRFWRSRRGDIYLTVAIALVVLVVGWAVWSSHVAATGANEAVRSANHARRPNPDANLTLMDKFLISVGLAERPEPPAYQGNPDVQVWVDLNTAQYYCPGSDLYQKTARGKLSKQREAQLDQFEPAYRKACD